MVTVEVVPSPKSQKELTDAGTELFVKLAVTPRQIVAGPIKSETTSLITTAPGFIKVSTQPRLLCTINATLKLPPVK